MADGNHSELPVEGWHADPSGKAIHRYWSGSRWTDWLSSPGFEPWIDRHIPPPPAPGSRPRATVEGLIEPVQSREGAVEMLDDDVTELGDVEQVVLHKRGSLNRIDNDAARAIKELERRYTYLADLTQHAPRQLRKEFGAHVQHERWRMLEEMPVEQLKDFADKVRTDPLIRAGINMTTLLAMNSEGFALIPGVGPVTAGALRLAVAGARKWAAKQEVGMPQPDQLRPDQTGLLRAAARELRARSVPQGLVPSLESTLDELEAELKSLRQMRSPVRRLVRRGGTPEEIQAAAVALQSNTLSEHLADLVSRADAAILVTQVPNTFDDLVAEYSARFADYGSILDEVITELGGVDGAIVERARGGLPAQLASRIERTELRLAGLDVHLRGYQEFGAQFMVTQNRVILGDEMGLGKTIQALAVMTHVTNAEGARRLLVVAPASLLANWQHEIEQRTGFQTHLLQGANRDEHTARWLKSGGVAVVSFSSLIRLRRLDEIAVDVLVVDEAHYIKNPESRRSKAVEKLGQHATRLLLMTGTPMENRVEEFKNLVRVTDPPFYSQVLGSVSEGKHGFRAAIAPLYLRRNQEDVLRELPERIELEEWVDLGPGERRAHEDAVRQRNVMGMRQAAIFGSGQDSAKLQRLKEILEYYEGDGQKVIVFSYFLDALSHVQEIAPSAFRLDGKLDAAAKLDVVQRFSSVDGHAVLVSQITAGGVGLNIQAASVVVLLEPQFKPTTEWQAIARAHRMGQSRRVMVHRLIAGDCIDASLYALVGAKSKLFDEYARESMLKEATSASTDRADTGLITQLLSIEEGRLVPADAE